MLKYDLIKIFQDNGGKFVRVIVLKNSQEVCKKASDIIGDVVKNNKRAFLGLATGGSAEMIYSCLVEEYKNGNLDFSECSSINLDEYIGLPSNHEQSYRRYMDDKFFNHININKDNTHVPVTVGDLDEEISRLRNLIEEKEGTDVQLLGVGSNGHIAFNEPNEFLNAGVSIVDLNEDTIKANSRYFDKIDDVPRKAISLGMGDILKSKKIVLVAFGKNKAKAVGELLNNDRITTQVPCTLLKTHRDVTIIIDDELNDEINA